MIHDDWCIPDGCPAAICGGPHLEIKTTLGTEIVKVGQETIGHRVAEATDGAE